MVVKFVLVILLSGFITTLFAIGLADFVPGFLLPKSNAKQAIAQKDNQVSVSGEQTYQTVNPVANGVRHTKKVTNYCDNKNSPGSDSVFVKMLPKVMFLMLM